MLSIISLQASPADIGFRDLPVGIGFAAAPLVRVW
jgi:hypothetical protein